MQFCNKGEIMKILNKLAMLSIVSINLAGCATVINGTSTDYVVKTTPAGATVKFTGGQECTTPCTLELKRKTDVRADITLAGHKPTYVLIQSKFGGAGLGNIVAGGIIGGIVDGSNGASNKLNPNPLIVELVPEGASGEAKLSSKDGKKVQTVKEHNDSVRADVEKTLGNTLVTGAE
jgi:hypothetical protein